MAPTKDGPVEVLALAMKPRDPSKLQSKKLLSGLWVVLASFSISFT